MSGSGEAPSTDPAPARLFEWQVYADATFAGLSALLPLPLLDLVFEGIFRRRLPRAIARYRGLDVAPEHIRLLGQGGPLISFGGCLALPFKVLRWVLVRVWRKLIYPLAVIDAARLLSEYWHRARLVDHILSSGHLAEDPERTFEVFDQVLDGADTSPIRGVAEEVVRSAGQVLGILIKARRQAAARLPDEVRERLDASWERVQESLDRLVEEYESVRQGAPPRPAPGGEKPPAQRSPSR